MAGLRVPVICIVIGEGGSGGALALGVGNHIHMLENSTYSVISPEGAAALLWKDASLAQKAAATMSNIGPEASLPVMEGKANVYSEYSLMQSTNRMNELVKRAKQLGYEAIALTDHHHMYGVIPFYLTAKDVVGVDKDTLVGKVMTPHPITVGEGTSVASVAHIMVWEGIELLPVIDAEKRFMLPDRYFLAYFRS